jgi:hypothetical protein
MMHRGIRRVAVLLGGLLLVAVGAAACTTKAISVEDLQASASPTTAAPTGPGRYAPVDDVCSVVEPDALFPAFPFHGTLNGRGDLHFPSCSFTVGPSASNVDQLATLQVSLDVGPVGTFNQQSEFDFDKQLVGHPVTTIDVLGQGAYYYTDPTTGLNVNAYDGNAYVKVVLFGGTPKFAMPLAGQDLVIAFTGRVLQKLPRAS